MADLESVMYEAGLTNPMVLEFDHLADKAFNISHALPFRAWQAIRVLSPRRP